MRKRILTASCTFLLALAAVSAARADDATCAAVSAPAVTVNAFNRTQTLNDLFVVQDGKLKRYEVDGGDIHDTDWLPSNAKMGDALHSQPAVVVYGGKPDHQDVDDAVLYITTSDGYVRAIDAKSGAEQWAWVPQDVPAAQKHNSFDGSIRVLEYDTNGDGVVDPADNDRVILFFGQGRAGDRYFALDVTEKKPKLLWAIGPTTAGLENMGQTWSTPTIARVNILNATQNLQKLVLIFGGGYDDADARGNSLYIVDAVKGTVLWSGGRSGADRPLKRMGHAIPSDVTVLDLDGDGYADRMYVGDMAAQLWRFDIFNGKPVEDLVAGGVIASLGTHDDTTHANAAARRFYNAPDVAAIRRKGVRPFFNIAIGSGYRPRPLSTDVQDRFYSIRDYQPFEQLTQEQYDDTSRKILQDKDLADVTPNVGDNATPLGSQPVAMNGWRVLLHAPDGTWLGEKVLASATTFDNQVLFPTFTPAGCSNRVYTLDVFSGSGQYTKLSQRSMAPQVVFLFPDGGNPALTPHYRPTMCLSGAESLGACRNFKPLVKTYWSESDAK